MRQVRLINTAGRHLLLSLLFTSTVLIAAESTPPGAATAHMIVTIESSDIRNSLTPTIADIAVTQNSVAPPITKLVPLTGERSSVEMFLLVDDCSNFDPGSRVEELRSFLLSQPSSSLIGSAYIRTGHAEVIQAPTPDRNQLIDSLTPPKGCKPASPFVALSELINAWKRTNSRRVILIISDGIDPEVKEGYKSVSAEAVLESSQFAGVIVYAIYHPSENYAQIGYKTAYSGQVLLAHLAQETGGQAYFSGIGPEISITPYLSDIARHLANQYAVEFISDPAGGDGLKPVTVKTLNPRFDIMAPCKILVPR
jgi:hypothetical protein